MITGSPHPSEPSGQLSTAELVSRTLADAKQLARTELELAKHDLRIEAHQATLPTSSHMVG